MSFSTGNTDHLIRSNVWTSQLKDVLEDDLQGMKYVKMITDFPDGDTMNMPSIGAAESYDYTENQAIRYSAMDTGNFTFSITDYKASAVHITNKMKQDSYYMNELVSSFVPKQSRAIMEAIEAKILSVGPDGQTASDANLINSAKHRFVASGTNQVITVNDFARAQYALKKANVPQVNLVAIVDPSVEYAINAISNITNVSNNPRWEGIVSSGIATGMKFIRNIYGFDVYVSNHLKSGITETIDGVAVSAGEGVANLFFSAAGDVLPIVGSIRQAPKVDSSYNKDFQRDEYVTTCRYGFKLFRPENLVTVISANDQVYA
jgi:HK97 family phage major capsid protein